MGEVIIANLLPHLKAIWPVIKVSGLVIGFCLVIGGFIAITNKGRQSPAKGAIFAVLAGVMLLNSSAVLNVLANSLFGNDSATGLSYSAPGGSDPTSLYITFAVYVVQLVGLAGIVYGGILLKRSAEDGSRAGTAMTHLIGGTFAVNIVATLHLFAGSMGPSVESAVARFLG